MTPRKARAKQATHYAEGVVQTTCWAAAIASALLFTSGTRGADGR